jgi:uncharacterized phiE125 gp8 family phage protein
MSFMMNPRRLLQPALEPVSLAEVKLFLRIEHDAEDALLTTMIRAAREAAEAILNTSFIHQQWEWVVETLKCRTLTLPMAPVVSVSEVASRDASGIWTVIAPSDYALAGVSVTLGNGISDNVALRVRYQAGISASAFDVPAVIKHALLEHITHLYETRGLDDVTDISSIYSRLREVRL